MEAIEMECFSTGFSRTDNSGYPLIIGHHDNDIGTIGLRYAIKSTERCITNLRLTIEPFEFSLPQLLTLRLFQPSSHTIIVNSIAAFWKRIQNHPRFTPSPHHLGVNIVRSKRQLFQDGMKIPIIAEPESPVPHVPHPQY
ncbi:MAG: hypothetical protein M2R45_01221 [Verrucomicrobia subdivision 3 bacterium]|nr:hypothetical protein [Limisphaerales bacterium]MCS1415227.1 hypothetical protein [Limisphaerales bacterium]